MTEKEIIERKFKEGRIDYCPAAFEDKTLEEHVYRWMFGDFPEEPIFDQGKLDEVLAILYGDYLRAIKLHYGYKETIRDTANCIDRSIDSTKILICRAVNRLRRNHYAVRRVFEAFMTKAEMYEILQSEREARIAAEKLAAEHAEIAMERAKKIEELTSKSAAAAILTRKMDGEYERMTSIEVLGLSKRAYNSLTSCWGRVSCLYDLLQYTPKELLKIRNLGKISRDEIIAKLGELGYSLAED